jgi:3-carboxy-cis,cis-muconate cycloisomerase
MDGVFSDRARLQGLLDFEAALARTEARLGVIPAGAAQPIALCCTAQAFDPEVLAEGAAQAGNLAIPLVRELTRQVARTDPAAAGFVHWGATSQDAIDTGLMLQLRAALVLIEGDLERLVAALATLVERERDTVLAGRTWMQQAVPITFGLKVATWLDAVLRHQGRIARLQGNLVLQFGGAAGTLASLGDRGAALAAALAAELGLALPDLPWHTQRDRVVEVATTLGMLVGTLGKIARDVALLMQTEVAEAGEPSAAGRGGSSTMPHKRNPVAAANVLAAALRVPGLVATLLSGMVQEHERGLGGWHAEWEVVPEVCRLSAGALAHSVGVCQGLELDRARMRAHLDLQGGVLMAEAVTMALGARLGRAAAHALLERAVHAANTQGRSLAQILASWPEVTAHLGPAELETVLDPAHYLGASDAFIDAVLARAAAARGAAPQTSPRAQTGSNP